MQCLWQKQGLTAEQAKGRTSVGQSDWRWVLRVVQQQGRRVSDHGDLPTLSLKYFKLLPTARSVRAREQSSTVVMALPGFLSFP